jgi:hypothetical protein
MEGGSVAGDGGDSRKGRVTGKGRDDQKYTKSHNYLSHTISFIFDSTQIHVGVAVFVCEGIFFFDFQSRDEASIGKNHDTEILIQWTFRSELRNASRSCRFGFGVVMRLCSAAL